ncbi:MAG: GAF domain-containing protein [Bacteroides sp.]|nr:GAF domain-containing protein [Bacteroides sp.]MDD4055256.1 GAF domain-containing protein [Bacteroides sp.]MDD4719878.1 GAF domain-containing protein [Bacteroides sp.]NLI64035.1 GAF domain-containing protein [Bacteroidales bacterium]
MITKEEQYQEVLSQAKMILADESDLVANLANIAALIKETFHFFWVGFYWVKNNELVLGPFQGPIACTRIAKGRGVCGTAWQNKSSIIVPDVTQFEGHIACSPHSKSEIVIPLIKTRTENGNVKTEVIGILDVDHNELNTFDAIDERYLNMICEVLLESSSI